jgi:hypothetical protein
MLRNIQDREWVTAIKSSAWVEYASREVIYRDRLSDEVAMETTESLITLEDMSWLECGQALRGLNAGLIFAAPEGHYKCHQYQHLQQASDE